jgi:hypothetical protein
MKKLPNETLDNAINVYKTCIKNAVEYDDDCEYNPILDRATVKFLEELKAYRNLEEQGRLIVLPCRDGDTVYKICSYCTCDYDDDCPEFYKCEDEYEEPCEYQYKGYCVAETRFRKEMLAVLGKTIFLTKAEAEKALAEMGE